MHTPERIDALYRVDARAAARALEALRLTLKGCITKSLAAIAVPFALFFVSDAIEAALPPGAGVAVGAVSFILIFAGVAFAGFRYLVPGMTAYTNYKGRFKQEVVSAIFSIVNPSGTYAPAQGIAEADFEAPGLFNSRGAFKSDDRVRGDRPDAVEAAEVSRRYATGGKNSTTVVVFHGLFFHLDFNKALRGVTLVEPADAAANQRGNRDGLTRVSLESPDFERMFAVYVSDDVEARYVLTPALMEHIMALRQRTGKPLFLGFKGHRAYLGVHYGRALFEPGIASTTSRESIREMAEHFALAEHVVQELDLNTRIWTKGVDDTLLRRPDDAAASAIDAAAASGTLTEATLWTAATAALGGLNDDGGEALVARPGSTSVQIDAAGAGLAVRYPIGPGFLVAAGLSALSLAIGVAALRQLPTTIGLGGVGPLLQQMPPVPVVTGWVEDNPVPWLAGCSVLGGLATLGSIIRVRRVEIGPGAVRVWRGLRPFPRTYPRPPYDRVIRIEKSVHIGKADGVNLINPTASPMLTAEESRWVAAEMRRAMKATASSTPAATSGG